MPVPSALPARRNTGVTARAVAAAALAVAALFLIAALGACSGDATADEGRGDVAPDAWAGQICQALAPWRTELDKLMVRAQQRMDAAKGPEQAKNGLVELLGGAEAASEQARARVAAAGQPDAGNGRRIAAEFTDSLRRTRDAYGRAKTSVAALPTKEAKVFYDAVAVTFGQLNTDYAAGALDLSKVSSPELKRAFDEVPACR